MLLKEKMGTPYLQFLNLEAFSSIRHAVFTRRGGFSKCPHDSLNVSYSVGDRKENVAKNRRKISAVMGHTKLVFARQVHGCNVLSWGEKKEGYKTKLSGLRNADALVSSEKGFTLVLKAADCQPILMFDPVCRVVAGVHSGWRGSVLNIAGQAVNAMKERFGCDPRDIFAGIGPSLGPCCSEFIHYEKEIPKSLWGYRKKGVFFDFWEMSRDQLRDAGVLNENIHTSQICTRCHSDRFFSYRKQSCTGRFAAAIGLV